MPVDPPADASEPSARTKPQVSDLGQLISPILAAISERRVFAASPAWIELAVTVKVIDLMAPLAKPLTENLPDVLKVLARAMELVVESPEVQHEKPDPARIAGIRAGIERLKADAGTAGRLGKETERFLVGTLTARLVDNFELYLAQMLTRVLLKYPGPIEKMQVSVAELRECASVDDAVARIVEKKVHELTFDGLPAVTAYLDRYFSVKIDSDSEHYKKVLLLTEVRHLVTHNGGRVTRRFLERTKVENLALGAEYPLSWTELQAGAKAIFAIADEIDHKLLVDLKLLNASNPNALASE